MKTESIPDNVLDSWTHRLAEQTTALGRATDMVRMWESVEAMYEAQKATLPDSMKLRIRRLAMSARDSLEDAKATFLDAEAWLDSWARAGQKRMAAFASLGAQLEPFTPSSDAGDLPPMPAAKAALDLIDEAYDHLRDFVWDGDLFDTYQRSKEAQ